jgi:hypothetical protein
VAGVLECTPGIAEPLLEVLAAALSKAAAHGYHHDGDGNHGDHHPTDDSSPLHAGLMHRWRGDAYASRCCWWRRRHPKKVASCPSHTGEAVRTVLPFTCAVQLQQAGENG